MIEEATSAEEEFINRMVKAIWMWGYSCGIDNIDFEEQGDSCNEMCKATAMELVDKLYPMLHKRTALWYPDNSGEWVEVPSNLMSIPCNEFDEVLFINQFERDNKSFVEEWVGPIPAIDIRWDVDPSNAGRVVAYRIMVKYD